MSDLDAIEHGHIEFSDGNGDRIRIYYRGIDPSIDDFRQWFRTILTFIGFSDETIRDLFGEYDDSIQDKSPV